MMKVFPSAEIRNLCNHAEITQGIVVDGGP